MPKSKEFVSSESGSDSDPEVSIEKTTKSYKTYNIII